MALGITQMTGSEILSDHFIRVLVMKALAKNRDAYEQPQVYDRHRARRKVLRHEPLR